MSGDDRTTTVIGSLHEGGVIVFSLLVIPLSYLLGSMSGTYVVGRIVGNVDMRTEDDGRISAAAVYRRLGLIPFLMVVMIDMGMAALAVIIARMLTESLDIALVAGFAAVVGHNWSVFLRFKGGLGSTAIGGVLGSLLFWQFLFCLGVAGLVLLATRRPALSTSVYIIVMSGVLLIQKMPAVLAIYPVALFVLMLLKRTQVDRGLEAKAAN